MALVGVHSASGRWCGLMVSASDSPPTSAGSERHSRRWPTSSPQAAGRDELHDSLFRNLSGDSFREVTALAGVGDQEFSFGPAIGDFDGELVQCRPTEFPGQPDRFYLNLGNGQFRDATEDAGLWKPDGKCMGLLAADLDGAGGVDLFVASDTRENLLFWNRTPVGGQPKFEEIGRSSGVAFDARGRLQGSMGLASHDVNGDGMLDLFVTNFFQEPNNLYTSLPGTSMPLYDDRGSEWGVAAESREWTGWGAQFLDADLD